MECAQLFQKARDHYEKKIPFVMYSLPYENAVRGAFQKKDTSYVTSDFSEESFVMAPFDYKGTLFQIPFKDSEFYEVITDQSSVHGTIGTPISESDTAKKNHLAMVSSALENIKAGNAQKIVVSRKKDIPLSNFSITKLCTSLFSQYEDAFTYVWYHPETNIWCGATPEVLLHTNGLNFNTMALAGTQRIDDKMMIHWTNKEKMEQKWVADAIVESLENKASVLKVSKTKTHIAGNLAHIKTNISGVLNTTSATLKNITMALHPTPAVCGTPRDEAMKFITKNEGYDRSYYTGFLGPVCENKRRSRLFVNLRCMSIKNNVATLYAGGGITIDSNPEEEWDETHNKLQTIAKVLQPLL